MSSHLQRMQMPQNQGRNDGGGSLLSYPSQGFPGVQPQNEFGNPQSVVSGPYDPPNAKLGSSIIMPPGGGRTGSVASYQPSSMMGKSKSMRSMYSASNMRLSKSMGGSKASLATIKSGRSTIQAEFHDRKVHREMRDLRNGKARIPLIWSIVFFSLFVLTLFIGLLVLCLRYVYYNIVLSLDIGEMTGPLLCALSFVFLGLGMKFLVDSFKMSAQERTYIKFKPSSSSTVQATKITKKKTEAHENLASGKTTENAVTRMPVGIQNYQYQYTPTILE
ncbi:hypothetical protein Ciccas_003921 [Cichlidogyrus casuarinus]|uniref:Uncharacterized protein n=1 Tax=Cichlidogyrus casuarinus TaxID=1844966 RepID=A0ABD2QCZ2_9PLAT